MNLHPLVGIDSQRPDWLAAMKGVLLISGDMLKTNGRLDLDLARENFVRIRQWLRGKNKWRNHWLFALDLEPYPTYTDGEWVGPHLPDDYAALLGIAASVLVRLDLPHTLALTGYPALGCEFSSQLTLPVVAMPNMYPRAGKVLESMQSARKVLRWRTQPGLPQPWPMVSPWDKVGNDPDRFAWAPECGAVVLELCRVAGVTDAAVFLPNETKIEGFDGDPVAATLAWMTEMEGA